MPFCEEICIPGNLHLNDRTDVKHFDDGEKLYRRFIIPKTLESKIEEWPSSILKLDDDSYNRSKYSEPEDVLYAINKSNCDKKHYHFWGIYEIDVNGFNNITENFKIENEVRTLTFNAIHSPTACMYPHSELFIYEKGKQLSRPDFKGLIRPTVRTFLRRFGSVIKKPDFENYPNKEK